MPKKFTALLLAALALTLVFSVTGCGSKAADTTSQPVATEQPAAEQPAEGATTGDAATSGGDATSGQASADVTELKIEELKAGTGAEAVAGKSVTVNYTGWLTDGTKFDSSLDSGQPFTFNLGAGEVIPGWDQGVVGMKVGGKRKLTIPSDLAYGSQGAGGVIPPNATLVFEVELLGVK